MPKTLKMKEDLRILIEKKLDISQQCALASKKVINFLGSIKRSVVSTSRITLLLYFTLERPHLYPSAQGKHDSV